MHMLPWKTQISLHIYAVLSVFDGHYIGSQGSNISSCGKQTIDPDMEIL